MSLFRIKICGVRYEADVTAAADAGADAIGFNFYSPSVRSVSIEQASDLIGGLNSRETPWTGRAVGVFVNHSADQIAATVETTGLGIIQLHGDERPSFLTEIRNELTNRSVDPTTPIIRAVRVAKDLELAAGERELDREVSAWKAAGASMVLLDAAVPGSFGGTGELLDWHALSGVTLPLPYALAGGLKPANVAEAIAIAGPDAVDVASGVEDDQDRKDSGLINQFVSSARTAFEQGV